MGNYFSLLTIRLLSSIGVRNLSYLLNRSMDNVFFKPCNHARGGQALWLKDRKERTEFNIKTMRSS